MSIKKGKKQVYKVGREVRVVECADMTREHLGIKGKIIDILEDGTYVVNGTTELCAAEKVSPLKPKKSIKKMYKSKDIEKLFKPIKLREFLKEKALEKEQTEQAKAIKELLKRVRVLEDNQREPNSFMSLQFLTCKRCGGEIKGAHYC